MNTLYQQFRSRASSIEDRPAIISRSHTLTYGEFFDLIEHDPVLCPPDALCTRARVLIQSDTPVQVLLGVFAAWARDCVPVVISENLSAPCVRALGAALHAAAIFHRGIWTMLLDSHSQNGHRRAPAPDEALVLMTSGTSGKPKAVALPDTSVLTNVQAIVRAFGIDRDDRLLVCLPLSHIYGLVSNCLVGLWAGASLCLHAPTTPAPLLHAVIREQGITVVQGTPTFHRLFLSYWTGRPFDSVRLLTVGAEVCGEGLTQTLLKAFPNASAYSVYGMTEIGPRVSHISLRDSRCGRGAIGQPYDHIEWKIVNSADSDGEMDGDSGVLAVRGSSLFKGYISSDGTYRGLEPDGFFITRDRVRADDDGVLFLLGRSDSAIKVGDRLVYPMVVERTLLQTPGVMDARVVARRHHLRGHVLTAEVVPQPRASISPADVLKACRHRLDPSHVPVSVVFVDQITTGSNGTHVRR